METLSDGLFVDILQRFIYDSDGVPHVVGLATLERCKLVCRKWYSLAGELLGQILVCRNDNEILEKIPDGEPPKESVREIVFLRDTRPKFGDTASPTMEHILKAFTPKLSAVRLFGGMHTSLTSQPRYKEGAGIRNDLEQVAPIRDAAENAINIRHASLGDRRDPDFWVAFFLVVPNLQSLTIINAAWTCGRQWGEYPHALPKAGCPFQLRRLSLKRSHILPKPLGWLLPSSSASLHSIQILYQQREWTTLKDLSELRRKGLLPAVKHLEFSVSDDVDGFLKEHVTEPLNAWAGLETFSFTGSTNAMRGAIINGIGPCNVPVVHLRVMSMRLIDLKSMFRTRKSKLAPGTILKLHIRPPSDGLASPYETWDWQSLEYWLDVFDDAVDIAARKGVVLEIA